MQDDKIMLKKAIKNSFTKASAAVGVLQIKLGALG